ncbi:MAG: hypothetical protein PHW53_01180 [Patescibacteria group bacterium]|nr:hypothetical protein [Patescibacteria group bacterium]
MSETRRARLLAVKYPMGHAMGKGITPLMFIAESDWETFLHFIKPDCDEFGVVNNKEEFLENLKSYKPGIVRAIRDCGGSAVDVQIWNEWICFFPNSPL